jgi:hypothetical protein
MVFIIGVGKAIQNMPFMHLSANEIDVRWQYRYANQYPKAIRKLLSNIGCLVVTEVADRLGLCWTAKSQAARYASIPS